MKIKKIDKIKRPKMDDFKNLSKMFNGPMSTADSSASGRLKVDVSGKLKKTSAKKTIIKKKLKNYIKSFIKK